MDASDVGAVLIVVLGGLGFLAWLAICSMVEQAAKGQVDELIAQVNRTAVLERQLEQVRGTERSMKTRVVSGESSLFASMPGIAAF